MIVTVWETLAVFACLAPIAAIAAVCSELWELRDDDHRRRGTARFRYAWLRWRKARADRAVRRYLIAKSKAGVL